MTAKGKPTGRNAHDGSDSPKTKKARTAQSGEAGARHDKKRRRKRPLPPAEVSRRPEPEVRTERRTEPSPRSSVAPDGLPAIRIDTPQPEARRSSIPIPSQGARLPIALSDPGVEAVEPSLDPPASARLRTLEQRLERMTQGGSYAETDAGPASIREQMTVAAREVVDRLAAPVSRVDDSSVVESVRELLSGDYYLRQWGRLGMRNRSEEVDDFGLDPVYERSLEPFIDFLYRRYFRVSADGIENIPDAGRCLLVANHSGTLPLDGLMLRACLRLEHPNARDLRWLAEDYVYHLPFVGAFMSRVGGVRACPENAERLLGKEGLVAVFPEGVKGIGKLFRDRYRLQRFGRGGFIRLCLRTGTPLVPCAVVGAEEASPMLHRDEILSKLLGLPYLPITPTFPWFGPLGLLPAPTKWRIRFGEILRFDGYGQEAADDPVLVGRLADRVRAGIQQLLDRSLAERKSVWLG